MKQTFYHGTNIALNIGDYLLSPMESYNLRESWRTKHNDVVFITTSLLSATKYAKKADPNHYFVYVVQPIPFHSLTNLQHNEYCCTKAKVIGIILKKEK